MRKNLLLTCSLSLTLLTLSAQAQTGVTIGATTAPHASAALEIVSSSQGMLLPRVASAAAIATPATGLIVYQTGGTAGFYFNTGTPAAPSWQQIATASGAAVTAGNGLTKTGANLTLGGSLSGATTIGLGTSNLLLTSSGGKVGIGTSAPFSGLSLSQVTSASNTPNQTVGELSFVGFNRPLPSASILAQSPGWDDASHLVFKTSIGSTGAVERLRIEADGDVGIGTSNPGHPLTVQAPAADTRLLGFNNASGTDKYNWSLSGGGLNLSESNVAGGRLFLKDGGNVGIANTNPAQALDVTGNIAASGSLGVLLNQQDRPLITRGYDAFTSGNYSGAGRWGLFMESSALTMGVPAIASRNFQWVTYNANSTVADQLMTLTQAGNLGIGTTAPAQALEVSGATAPTSVSTAPQLRLSRPGILNAKYDNVFDMAVGSYGLGSGSQTRVDFQLSSLTSTTDATPLSLLANGTAGINTTAPATTLDVRTTDNSAAITVGSTGGGVGALYLGNGNHGLKRNYSGGNDVGLYTTSGNVYLSANATSTSQFSLLNSGNVGIGTATPGYKLEVNGTALINTNYDLLLRDANAGLGWYGSSGKVFTAVSTFDGPVLYGFNGGMLGTKDGGNRAALYWNKAAQVGIGTTAPEASAQLDISSTSKGFLPPRMSQTQRDDIASPAGGLTVFNTTTDQLNIWNGTAWTEVIAAAPAATLAAVTFNYTGGAQTYTVPAGMTLLKVTAVGAAGGLNSSNGFAGGQGGSVTATIPVTPGETLNIYVGGKGGNSFSGSVGAAAGYNGGGQGFARFSTGGGGATDLRRGSDLADRVVVAGGGGGSGANSRAGAGGNPGVTGNSFNGGGGGQGGTQGGGGAGGTGTWTGVAGTLGQGGNAGVTGPSSTDNGTGAGGGGYYGGGGGGLGPGGVGNGGGGGGSSWAAANATEVSYQTGGNTGNGSLTLVASALPAPAFDGGNIVNVGPWKEAGDNVYRAGGKVGIGTSSPQQALDVSGSLVVGAGDLIKAQGAHLQWNRYVGGGETFLLNQQGGGPGGIIFGKSDAVSSGNNNITEWGRFDQNGNLGIGTNNPGQKLTVIGNICASGGLNCASDGRYKKDVTELQGALANVMKMRGVTYYWKQAEFPDKQFPARRQLGVIAQEIETYYPEMVTTDTDGYKSVDYSRLTPVLLEAMKEQQAQIEALKEQNAALQGQVTATADAFEARLRRLEAGPGPARK